MSFNEPPLDELALDTLEAELPLLLSLRQFGEEAANIAWFSNLGRPLAADTAVLATDYLEALGFGDASAAPLTSWAEALDAAATGDMNSPAWEAEEQARASLVVEACTHASEEGINVVLTYLAAGLDEVLREAAEGALYDNEDINGEEDMPVNLLVGAAQQALYQAALAYGLHMVGEASESEETDFDMRSHTLSHPLYLKYALFAHGHWPVAIIGRSFHIF